jgi:hypothetical protein
MKLLFIYFKVNKEINFLSIMPIKSLFLDVLNHEQQFLKPVIIDFIKTKLLEFQTEEQ